MKTVKELNAERLKLTARPEPKSEEQKKESYKQYREQLKHWATAASFDLNKI